MMPILVKSDDIRSGRKAKARHGQLQAALESMGLSISKMADWNSGYFGPATNSSVD